MWYFPSHPLSKNTRTVWCGLGDWSNSIESLTCSLFLLFIPSVVLGQAGVLRSWFIRVEHPYIKELRHYAPNFEPWCLSKHHPLCWLPYGPAALLSHAADVVLCPWHDISCSSGQLWCPDESPLYCLRYVYVRIRTYTCTKFLALKELTWGQRSRASQYIVRFNILWTHY